MIPRFLLVRGPISLTIADQLTLACDTRTSFRDPRLSPKADSSITRRQQLLPYRSLVEQVIMRP